MASAPLAGAVQLVWGNLAADVVGEDVEIFCGLGDGQAWLQVAESDVVAVVAVPTEVVEVDDERRDDFGLGPLAG